MTAIEYDASQFPDYLQIYYKRLFPYGPYYKWLTYGLAPQVSMFVCPYLVSFLPSVKIRSFSLVDVSS